MRVVALHGLKGGVGKTASALALAHLSAGEGWRTLLWDLDPQGAASFTLRVRPDAQRGVAWFAPGSSLAASVLASDHGRLDVVPADASLRGVEEALASRGAATGGRGPLRALLEPLGETHDHVVLDCAPGFSRCNEAALDAADLVLLPTIPTPLSLRTLAQLLAHLKRRGRPRPLVLPFFCLVDGRKKLHREVRRYVLENALGFAAAEVPYSSVVERMGTRRLPLGAFAPASPPAKAYAALWREVAEALGRSGEDGSLLRKRARKRLEEVVRSTFHEGR